MRTSHNAAYRRRVRRKNLPITFPHTRRPMSQSEIVFFLSTHINLKKNFPHFSKKKIKKYRHDRASISFVRSFSAPVLLPGSTIALKYHSNNNNNNKGNNTKSNTQKWRVHFDQMENSPVRKATKHTSEQTKTKRAGRLVKKIYIYNIKEMLSLSLSSVRQIRRRKSR